MIRNPKVLKIFDKEKLRPKDSFRLFDAFWKEALLLNVFPLKDPLEGIEVDIRIARILNSCLKSS